MRRHGLILLAVVVAIGAVVALAFVRQPTLGLDLQGGLEVVLEARAPKGQEVTPDGLARSVEIMRERVDKLGVTEPEIRTQGENQIAIELPGVRDAARAAEIVGTTARLEFYDLEGDLVRPSIDTRGFPVPYENVGGLLSGQQKAAREGTPTAWFLVGRDKNVIAGPASTRAEALELVEGGERPAGSKFFAVPEGRIVLSCGAAAGFCPGVNATVPEGTSFYYLFEYRPDDPRDPVPEMTGEHLRLSGTQQDFHPDTGEPIVNLEFTDEGGDRFHAITRELAQRGRSRAQLLNLPRDAALQHFAIVLDEEVRSFPSIDYVDNPDGIAGGRAFIQGDFTVEEAKDLALVLQTGALPYDFVQLDRTEISATLGEDSLREAMVAGLIGLALVVVFLLAVYRFLGVVAVIGLAIYGIMLYGTTLAFNVTLTLPGIAGIVLTIGVAADANIVIFERIKEEVRAGKSVRAAIAGGYRKGFNTIIDANVVTMITAAVLFAVATGGVRGFALMLLIGTLISMVTAVGATRALLAVLGGFRWFDNPAFMGASAQKVPDWQKVDIVGKRRIWFTVAAVALAIAIGSIVFKGLNLGIDFRGGSQVGFETPRPVAISDVRAELADLGRADAVVQGRGESSGGRYQSFQVKTTSLSASEQSSLTTALERELDASSIGVRNVSGSFSEQILRGAILAIVVSLILIVIYVTFRFEFKFALPIFRALFYDVTIAMGVYSLLGWEVTAATVAAILTILGYSMYDTIIIFDRVRENIPLMRRSSFAAIANQSLWETIRRSLATSFITLLPIASLIVFGGDTLKEFAFALLIGISSGAYSTIFIATPFLASLKEREPEYAKRMTAGLQEKLDVVEEARPAPAPARVSAPEPAVVEGDGGTAGDGAAGT
ncbi:MAG TPA: protein translocase subunit SecD, partial [Gaiellaceae bacterium]|nr:protein translocase subunit SecD [Gaiellaceae bacterium]